MTDRHAASPDSTGRSAVRTQGDAVSAYREIGLSAVTSSPAIAAASPIPGLHGRAP